MKEQKTDRFRSILRSILFGISAFAILAGALLKLWHIPTGGSLLFTGFMSYTILSSMEISRLKKIIAQSKRVVNPDEMR
jgi:hypothetical protein